jgi:GTP cyclohydrolase I
MTDPAEKAFSEFLTAIGVDAAHDPELRDTPRRYAALLREWFIPPPAPEVTPISFDRGQHEPVILKDLPFHSLCVHHVVPFFGQIHVAYLPEAHIVGFGAVGRVIDWCARRPQLQERLVADIADALDAALHPRALLVVCEARQMCMEMTGATPHGRTMTVAARGAWQGDSWRHARDLFSL